MLLFTPLRPTMVAMGIQLSNHKNSARIHHFRRSHASDSTSFEKSGVVHPLTYGASADAEHVGDDDLGGPA